MLQSAVGKRLEAEDRLAWTAFYMDELQRHERVQERGDNMKSSTYYMGNGHSKYGIWNKSKKQFQFGICEDTPMLAEARLFQKIGEDAKKWRFEVREVTT